MQLHRSVDPKDPSLYLLNAHRLFASDESLRSLLNPPSPVELLAQQLRPELTIWHNRQEPQPNLSYFTWKTPQRCHECHEVIQTYTYYYYEKKSVATKQPTIVRYYCCLDCFDRLAPKEAFKYPMNKILLRELPLKER